MELDACLDGLRGCWGNVIYHIPIVIKYQNLAITQLVMLNILAALKLFASQWHGRKMHIKCDILAVAKVLNSGKARDPILGACPYNI